MRDWYFSDTLPRARVYMAYCIFTLHLRPLQHPITIVVGVAGVRGVGCFLYIAIRAREALHILVDVTPLMQRRYLHQRKEVSATTKSLNRSLDVLQQIFAGFEADAETYCRVRDRHLGTLLWREETEDG